MPFRCAHWEANGKGGQMIPWWMLGDCLTSTRWYLNDCLTFIRWFTNKCLTSTRWFANDCLTSTRWFANFCLKCAWWPTIVVVWCCYHSEVDFAQNEYVQNKTTKNYWLTRLPRVAHSLTIWQIIASACTHLCSLKLSLTSPMAVQWIKLPSLAQNQRNKMHILETAKQENIRFRFEFGFGLGHGFGFDKLLLQHAVSACTVISRLLLRRRPSSE